MKRECQDYFKNFFDLDGKLCLTFWPLALLVAMIKFMLLKKVVSSRPILLSEVEREGQAYFFNFCSLAAGPRTGFWR